MEYIYGALLLHKLGKSINAESLTKVIQSTGTDADESKIKSLIASLEGVDINTELTNASAIAAAPGAGSGTPSEAKEEKKEEKPAESAAGLSSLFG